MNRSESKFKNTADKMDAALIALLENKDFSAITIQEICQKAGVNRSTFYAHYSNTYDLLKETHQNLIKNFLDECVFDSPVNLSDMPNLSKDELNFITPKYLLPYLQYIKNHKRLCKIYVDNALSFKTDEVDDYIIEKLFFPIYEKHGVTDKKIISYMQKYFLKGINAIIQEWIAHDCEDDILFICEILTFCVRPAAIYKK